MREPGQPEQAAQRAQARGLIEAKIDGLPEVFRTVFILRAVEELSVEETGRVLGIPDATVRSRYFRARGMLREALARELDFALEDAFGFDGERCNRIVANVMRRLGKKRLKFPGTRRGFAASNGTLHFSNQMETAMKKTLAPILLALLAAGLLNAAHAANPNDAQIAAIVVAANTVDIDAGKLAESKTKNKEVRAFAERMVADHSGVNQQAVALVKKLHVTPEENDTSKSLTQGGDGHPRPAEGLVRRRLRQGLCRQRGELPPDRARCDRQDPDPERHQRRAEGAADQGAAGLRRPPGACEAHAGADEMKALMLALGVCLDGGGVRCRRGRPPYRHRRHGVHAEGGGGAARRYDHLGEQGHVRPQRHRGRGRDQVRAT
jgi:hypothetical protein